jgi:hypothetical protein
MLNRSHVYTLAPYVMVGVALWACVLASGLHPTLAGIILALFIPTRPPLNLTGLTTQASGFTAAEAARGGEVLKHGPSAPALRARDAIHGQIESPADRLLRNAGARSSYLVLLLFALANSGVALRLDMFSGRDRLMAAIVAGLVVGNPLGLSDVGARGLDAAGGEAETISVDPTWGSRRSRGNRVHDVAVHRRGGVPGRGRFRGRQDRGIYYLVPGCPHWRDAALARNAKSAGLRPLQDGAGAARWSASHRANRNERKL